MSGKWKHIGQDEIVYPKLVEKALFLAVYCNNILMDCFPLHFNFAKLKHSYMKKQYRAKELHPLTIIFCDLDSDAEHLASITYTLS